MGLLEFLRQATDDDSDSLYECRYCGETVSPEVDECPDCGSAEIAFYKFD